MSSKKITGKGPILIDAAIVADMASWSLNVANQVETQAELDADSQSADYGLQSFTGSASGVSALADTTGQDLIRAATLDKTKIANIKFYETYSTETGDTVVYWQPKSGANGLVFSAFDSNKDGGSSTTKISFSWTCDGAMERKEETLT